MPTSCWEFKAILRVIKPDIMEAAGCLQMCAGQDSGCEAAVHCVQRIYQTDNTEGVLFVDASNTFNSLNRQMALHNILHLCPSLGRVLINMYCRGVSLFIDVRFCLSSEGTTQGDPLAMSVFTVATLPMVRGLTSDVRQVWYADDASTGGTITAIRNWWDRLIHHGPAFGYFPNSKKTVLIVKEKNLNRAKEVFMGTGISVTAEGSINCLRILNWYRVLSTCIFTSGKENF